MKNIYLLTLCVLVLSCTDESSTNNPMVGTYALTQLRIESMYSAISTTSFTYNSSTDTLEIGTGNIVWSDTSVYNSSDANSISGQVQLLDNGDATLAGSLPTNLGTPCDPNILPFGFASDGNWSVGTDSSFTLELDLTLAEDIYGYYSFDENTGLLLVDYTAVDDLDTLSTDSVIYSGAKMAVDEYCKTVSSVRYRVFSFLKNN